MKYLFLLFILLSNVSFADVYILYDKETNDIYSMSSIDDAVCPKTKSKAVLSGDLSDLNLSYDVEFYQFKNGKIKLDMKKSEQSDIEAEEYNKKIKKDKLIQDRMKKIAKDQLIAEGIIKEE